MLIDNDKINIQVSYRTPYYLSYFEKPFLKHITPKRLLDEGFEEIIINIYRKSFSNLISLTYYFGDDKYVQYKWDMNENNFKKANKEIKIMIDYIEKKFKNHYAELRKGEVKNVVKNTEKLLVKMINEEKKMKKDFLEKYKDFFSINSAQPSETLYFKSHRFFFDACDTTRQLRLYFKFIELSMYFLDDIIISEPFSRRITPKEIREGIAMYYIFFFTIKKIRQLYMEDHYTYEEIKNMFPMVTDKLFEDITLDSQNKKGWEYRNSDLSLNIAAHKLKTTSGNFKQILKQEKKYALKMKKMINNFKDINMVLTGKTIIPLSKFPLKVEEPLKSKFATIIEDFLIKKPKKSSL